MPDRDHEESFAEVAIELGFLTREQVEECRKAREALAREGLKARPLPQIAQEKGYLNRDQYKQVLLELRKRGVYQRIGGYEIIRKVGAGAMGVVYQARQVSLDRTVALKVLSPQLSHDDLYVERFEREAKLAARLTHPNAVQIHDVGHEEGTHFIVMEYVEGQPLHRLLKEGPLEEQRALKIVHDIAKALGEAHAQGIIHRDIKPSNILIRSDGIAKLSDLGIAKELGGATVATLTHPGAAIGTPSYMSPEQCSGEQDIDRRTDIYSLGITLYRMVCGKDPYCGTTPLAVIKQHVSEPLPDPKSVNPKISDPTAKLIRDMTQKDRDVRLQSCEQVVEHIEAVLSGKAAAAAVPPPLPQAATAPPPPPPPPPPPLPARSTARVVRPKRTARLLIAGIVVVIVTLGVVAFFVMKPPKLTGEKPPVAAAPTAQPAPGAGAKDATERYTKLVMEAMDAESAHDWARALELYRTARPLAEDVVQVDRAIARVTAARMHEQILREYEESGEQGAELARQEKWAEAKTAYDKAKAAADKLAAKPPGYQDLLTRLEEVQAALQGETQRRDQLAAYRGELAKGTKLSQDGKWADAKAAYVNARAAGEKIEPKPAGYEFLTELVAECDKQLAAAPQPPAGGEQGPAPGATPEKPGIEMVFSGVERDAGAEVRCVSFGLGGLGLACGRSDGTVSIWDLKTCRLATTLTLANQLSAVSSTTVTHVSFSSDGEMVAAAGYFNDTWLWQVSTGHCTTIKGSEYDVAFVPGGRILATGGCPARLWDAKTGRVVAELSSRKGYSTYSNFVVFSGDGKVLATGHTTTYSSSSRGSYTEKVVELWSLQTQKLIDKLDDLTSPIALSFNGQLVAGQVGGGQIGIYDLAKRSSVRISMPTAAWSSSTSYSDIKDLAFHPRKAVLACKTSDGKVTFLAVPGGKALLALKPGNGREGRIAFSPDGRLLASCYDYTSGHVDIWNTEKGTLAASLVAVGKGKDYAIWTPEGYYAASPTAEFSISARRDNVSVPRAEFKAIYNRPDLVVAKLAGKDVPAPGEAAKPPAAGLGGKPLPEGKATEPEKEEEKVVAEAKTGVEKVEVTVKKEGEEPAPVVVPVPQPAVEEKPKPEWEAELESKPVALVPGKPEVQLVFADLVKGQRVKYPCLALSPAEPLLASAGPKGTVTFWNLKTGRLVNSCKTQVQGLECIAFSPNGKMATFAGESESVELRQVSAGRTVTLPGGQHWAAFNTDGSLLVTAGKPAPRVWDVATGRLVKELKGATGEWLRVAFTADEAMVAASQWYATRDRPSGNIMIWKTSTGTSSSGIFGPSPPFAASPVGSSIAYTTSDRWLAMHDTRRTESSLDLNFKQAGSKVQDVVFSPDGALVACVNDAGEIKIWDVQGRREVASLQTCPGAGRIAISSDGASLATTTHGAGVVVIWNLKDRSRVLSLASCGEGKDFVVWTPEGYYIATAEAEKRIQVKVGGNQQALGDYGKVFHRPDLVAKALAGEKVPAPSAAPGE